MKNRRRKTPLNLSQELNKAKNLHQNGDFKKATLLYKKIIRLSPKNDEAIHMLGVLYAQSGKLEKAITLLRKSIEISPGRVDCLFNLARAYQDNNEMDNAISSYQKYLNLVPNDPEALHMAGICLQAKSKLDQAITCYLRALEKSPGHIDYLNSLGLAYESQDNYAQAKLCYEEANYNLGIFHIRQNRQNEAVASFEKTLAINAENVGALNYLGAILLQLGNIEEADVKLKKSLALNPDNPETLHWSGRILHEKKEFAKAVTHYLRALKIAPEQMQSLNSLGASYKELGDFRQAILYYEKASVFQPNDVVVLNNMADLLRQTGRIEEAITYFKRALTLKPDFPKVHAYMAIIYWINGDYESCKMHIDHITNTKEKLEGSDKKFIGGYYIFLEQLLKYRDLHSSLYSNKEALPILYLVGDSHCLSATNTKVSYKGVKYLATAKIIIGCKAWHLANEDENSYKVAFHNIIESIQPGSKAIFMFGEIDCRLDEGIIKDYKKTHTNLTDTITTMVDNYVTYLFRTLSSRDITPIICTVPAIIHDKNVSQGEIKLQKEVLTRFNEAIENNANKHRIQLLDFHTFAKVHGKGSKNECHIDFCHMKPSVLRDLCS